MVEARQWFRRSARVVGREGWIAALFLATGILLGALGHNVICPQPVHFSPCEHGFEGGQ